MRMAKQKKHELNLDDWVEVKKKTRISKSDPHKIRVGVTKPNTKTSKSSHMIIHIHNEMIDRLNLPADKKINFLCHKDNPLRILLFRSPTGNKLITPRNSCMSRVVFSVNRDVFPISENIISVEPIFHAKNKNSSAMLELDISGLYE